MKVQVAIYSHKQGENISVFSSIVKAEKWRQEIAAEWWDSEMPEGREKPVDPKQMADDYFENAVEQDYSEHFEIHSREVE